MTTVLDRTGSGAKMHAFIVGVGRYPYCVSAASDKGPAAALARQLGHLSSPPKSALSLARWLLHEQADHEVSPLGSIELLVSDDPAPVLRTENGEVKIEPANRENVFTAFDRWYRRCDSDPSNVALFFFSGHGLEYADQQILLLEDFGGSPLRVFENAFSFDKTFYGMSSCSARTQCYFVDACRETPDELRSALDGAVSLVNNLAGEEPTLSLGTLSTLSVSSAVSGERAWGTNGAETAFTPALLEAMSGLAARHDQVRGCWDITTQTLGPAMSEILDRQITSGEKRQHISFSCSSLGTPLRRLRQPPQITFRLGCDPTSALKDAKLGLMHLGDRAFELWRDLPIAEVWVGSTAAGIYQVNAEFPAGGYRDRRQAEAFLPPYVDFALPVEQV